MHPADSPSVSPSISVADNHLQPFFVLHKASPPCKPAGKTRRRIDLSPSTSDAKDKDSTEGIEDITRLRNFHSLWSKIESTIMEVLRNMNAGVFEKIDKWVRESFDSIRDCQLSDPSSAARQYPILSSASISSAAVSRKLFTALLFSKNIELVDDILTFVDLGLHLRSCGSYVANLSSSDFSAKHGVGGCLKALLRKFLMVDIDAPDISILASWYAESGNYGKPFVVIIDDVERCCGSVLTDFIVLLSEWAIKIPIILIVGVATTVDVLRNILSSNACSHLSPCEFTLGTPAEKMDAIIEAVLLKHFGIFGVGKQVLNFLRNYFLKYDGTVTLFVKALKISIAQQLCREPLSFMLMKVVDEGDTEDIADESFLLQDAMIKWAKDLPFFQRSFQSSTGDDIWASGLSKLERFRKLWCSMVKCLYEVGKYHEISLLDLFCEVLERGLCNTKSSYHGQPAKDNSRPSHNHHLLASLQKGGCVHRIIQIVRNLPAAELCTVLKSWEMHTINITEVHEKVRELQSLIALEDKRPKRDLSDTSRKLITKKILNEKMHRSTVNEKAATFLECMIRDMLPIESIPFNEVVFFNNVDQLQSALIGDPRRRIQADLLKSSAFLKCSCCKNGAGLSTSMPDSSIIYSLAQEHGDQINIHEWFHSFKAIVSPPRQQAKQQRLRLSPSPSPKKRKSCMETQQPSDASIQAEFCRAVVELQIAGLIRMPSKRRPDYVQRVTFGL